MNISLTKTDEVTGKLTVKLEKADYEPRVEKSLKKMKQQAKMPGFRPGMVPMNLIKKLYGTEIKAEELNRLLAESVNNYIKNEKLRLVADPLIADGQEKMNIETDENFEFAFDLGFAPEINVELTDKDKIPFYNIQVDDKTLDSHIENMRRQAGKYIDAESYDDENDVLRGQLVELENGAAKENGLTLDEVSLMPKYFVADDQKALFKGAKKGGEVTFNVSKAYEGRESEISSLLKIKKEEVAEHSGDFKFVIATISHFVLAEINQDLFNTFAGKEVKSEEEFRAKIKSDIENTYVRDSDYKLLLDVRDLALEKAGEVKFPEEILKRTLLENMKEESDKEKIDDILKDYIKELEWSLIRTNLAEKMGVKVDDQAVMDSAREAVSIQFAQYGINNIPDESLNQYAENMLKDEKQHDRLIDRAIDRQLTAKLKETLKLTKKKISIDNFNKMFEPKEAAK